MKAYIKNMTDQTGKSFVNRVIAYCPACGNEYSANKGDYFNMNRNECLKCETCGRELYLGFFVKSWVNANGTEI